MSRNTMLWLAAVVSATLGARAQAAVSDAEAQQLKTTLTPVGAERAGNASGTIPAWTGGYTTIPPGTVADSVMPDFFASDAKVLTIDAGNVDKYADHLSTGVVALMKLYKGFRIDVYPTRRTAAYPQWYIDKTFANATRAKLNGNWLDGIVGGVPFPIPKQGKEIAWNINLTWQGVQTERRAAYYIVPPNGRPQQTSESVLAYNYPYNDPVATPATYGGYYLQTRIDTVGPPSRVGEATLSWGTTDKPAHDLLIWQYLVGQRRLRKAPQILYDGTYPDCGGMVTVDELAIWQGAPDRYDFKIVGKKELYVPYNDNKAFHQTTGALLGGLYLNPDHIRWELHRVWVVDLDVAPGKRHLIPHRRIYVDEDTWSPLLGDDYDPQGQLWKVAVGVSYVNPYIPATTTSSQVTYELKGSGYCAATIVSSDRPQERPIVPLLQKRPLSFWDPATLAAEAVR